MALIITLILLTLGSAIMINVYSVFEPFLLNLKDVKDYNVAYYGAVSGIERANLSLRYHTAGFEGSGGWYGNKSYGPLSDHGNILFGQLYSPNLRNGMSWEIKNLTNGQIPKNGLGNIDFDLQGTGSKNYNKLDYNISEEILLYKDSTTNTGDFYKIGTTSKISNLNLFVDIRLPEKIEDSYNKSGTNGLKQDVDIDGDGIGDDNLVNRTFFGKYDGANITFYPNVNVDYTNKIIDYGLDSAIRESKINEKGSTKKISYSTNTNPANTAGAGYSHNMNPVITNLTGANRRTIFNDIKLTDLHYKLSLVNIIETNNLLRYPFLEYQIQVRNNSNLPIQIPDRFFDVSGVGQVGRYKVTLKQSVPVVKSYGFSDFTIVF